MIDLDHIYQFLRSTDGVNQFQRSLPALDPGFVGFDERSKTDMLNFLRALSQKILFYNIDNVPSGNWLPFFNQLNNVSVLANAAATGPLPSVIYSNGVNGIGATLTATAPGLLPPQDGVVMADGDLLLVWQQVASFQNGVYTIKQGSGALPFVLTRSAQANQPGEMNQQNVEVLSGGENGKRLFIQKTTDAIIGTTDIAYFKSGATDTSIPPHLALLLAFLQINAVAQQDMNRITGRHLAYYYEEVLQLKRKAGQPDQVHVVFEPAKNAKPTLIPAGALLDAGKSTDGKSPLNYSLDSELMVTSTLVQSLKSSYVDRNDQDKAILFKAEDAAVVKSAAGTGWRPFGDRQLNLPPQSRTMVESQVGFAVGSPALFLAEGERTITITLNSLSPLTIPLVNPDLEITITGEKGWLIPDSFTASLQTAKLIVQVKLSGAVDPIVAFNEAVHGTGYNTAWPVIRLLVRPQSFTMETLSAFVVNNVDIQVEALGVKNLLLQNDESIQPNDKPVLPFGSLPLINNNFYIGSTEVFSKTLQSISVHLEWKDPPKNFKDHYAGYDNPNISDDKFQTTMFLLEGRSFKATLLNNQSLFIYDTGTTKSFVVDNDHFKARLLSAGVDFERIPGLEVESFTPSTPQGFIKLVLTDPLTTSIGSRPTYAPVDAFGHKQFAQIYTHKAIDLATGANPNAILPNQPYTPLLNSVKVDYVAKESFFPSSPNGIEQFFQQDIFGIGEIKKNETARLAPEITGQAALYIGLSNAIVPQTLSLLFQVERGNVPGDELLEKADMQWSYLAGNQWVTIGSGDIIEDSTDSLQRPGIIRLNIGSDATSDGFLMPAGQHWVRLMVTQRADGAGAIEKIIAQAARATLVTNNSNTQIEILPPGTITRLVNKIPAIKSIHQDYPSFNGLPPEADKNYFRRVSERLRHRNRAIAGPDYERLTLEAFPDVFKVKCLPHTDADNNILPGHIKLIIVPDMRIRKGGNILQPKSNLAYLREIETFLQKKFLGGFVTPHAANPEYETLLVDCKVTFYAGFDPGFYGIQLQEDLRRFLSPWAYEEGKDIIFGGKVFKSEILAFVEGRPYVDFVVNFQLYHRFEGAGLPGGISCMTIGDDFIIGTQPIATIGSNDGTIAGSVIGLDFVIGEPVEVAIATRPDAILVSNDIHRIEVLQEGSFVCSGIPTLGIGQMVVGLDFIPIS